MGREVETVYGCFRCGVLTPTLRGEDKACCGECGERSIVTFRQALDMLNELYLTGRRKDVEEAIDIDEYYIEEKE